MSLLRTKIYVFLAVALSTHPSGAKDKANEPDIPAIPRMVNKVESVVPAGWEIIARASGDLNQDGKPDKVVIIDSADSNEETAPRPRLLIVLLADGDPFQFVVSAVSYNSVRPRHTGGVLGDPFEELKIERGTFVISHYAGSRNRWGFKHRYRWQNDGWSLIGRTTITHDTLSPEYHEKDENLITGRVIEKIVDQDGKKSKTDQRVDPVALLPLGSGEWESDGYFELP